MAVLISPAEASSTHTEIGIQTPIVKPAPELKIKPLKLAKKKYVPIPVSYGTVVKSPVYASSGNTYTPGQCTWGVKLWRPDIPNGWGNADRWYWNAQAQGWPTGLTPRAGAVGQSKSGMHVVFVVKVLGDKVLIREMNYAYIAYQVREVVRPASNYYYIY